MSQVHPVFLNICPSLGCFIIIEVATPLSHTTASGVNTGHDAHNLRDLIYASKHLKNLLNVTLQIEELVNIMQLSVFFLNIFSINFYAVHGHRVLM